MTHKAAFLLPLAAIFLPLSVHAKSSKPANLAEEYDQVRAIAQRDPKVRAAYEAADRRLADKIVEIDPALKGYTPGKSPVPATHTAQAAAAKPAPPKKQHTTAAPANAKAHGTTHTVTKGETIDGIANQYHVSAASIESANHVKDARKLAIGQKLVIPGGTAQPESAPAEEKPAAAKPVETKSQSFWDKWKF
jgi:LysM repeat protein